MITKSHSINYLKNLLTKRFSRNRNIDVVCDKMLEKIEATPIKNLMASTAELDALIAVLPLPHAMELIAILARRTPGLLEYMHVTVDARKRQASTLFKVLETFKPSHLEMIRAALESGQIE
ncbi:MAG: hypothetical protein Q7K26_02000 [bacterium]|nr:hypothetical protein [bacterium]